MTIVIEAVADDNNLCGEGPIWDHRRQCMWWVDLTGKILFQLNPSSGSRRSFPLVHATSAIAIDTTGALLLAGPAGLHLWEGREALPLTPNKDALPFNDLVADPRGRIYAGTLYLAANGIDVDQAGQLFLIDALGTHRVVDEGLVISNGLSLSPDGNTLYHADTGARLIYAYTISPSTGTLSAKRELCKVSEEDGVPDGITVDAAGNVWCALWFSGKIVQYDSDGKLLLTFELPISQPSSLAFGGNTLQELYVTTASERWNSPLAPESFSRSSKPHGGSLYCINTETRGKLEHCVRFAAGAQCSEHEASKGGR